MRFFHEFKKETTTLQDLQRKISLIFILLTFFSILFFGVSDFLMGQATEFLIIRLVFAFLFIGGYFLFIHYKKQSLATHLMLALVLGFMLVNYVYNDGYQGPTIYNFFVFFGAIAILMKYPLNAFWHFLSIGLYILIFYLEVTGNLSVTHHYKDINDLFWDNSITIFVTSIFLSIGATMVIINYQKQNLVLIKLQEENKKNLQELQLINDKKNQLIALLSHDLKNPVASLSTTLELKDLDLISKEDFGFILSSLKKQSIQLNYVLSNTLNWVVTEMGNQPVELSRINLYSFSEEVQQLMQLQASEKGQKIELLLENGIELIQLEKEEIKIILRNYLSNAIKFSPVGATIYMECIGDENKLRWNIKNPGKLIPDEIQKQLFDFNVKSAVGTQMETGTGLGLSLCRRIADKIGVKLGNERTSDGMNLFYLEKSLVN